MTPKQRQYFLKKINSQNPEQKTSEYMPLQNGNSIKEKKYLYLPLKPEINQIFDKESWTICLRKNQEHYSVSRW